MSKVIDGFEDPRYIILELEKLLEESSWPEFAATYRLWKVIWKNPMMKFLGTLASNYI